MGFQNDLLIGVAVLLDAAGVATWDSAGAYGDNQTGITIQATPSSPPGIAALSTYPVTDDPSLSDSVLGLQVRVRMAGADPRPVNDLADAIFDQLHGLAGLTLNTGVRIVECLHRSGALLGQDENQRWSRSDNYYVTTWRPSPNRQ